METIKELLYVPRCESTKRADLVTRAFEISWGDLVFVWTISSESVFHSEAVGDWGLAFWFCQFRSDFQPDNYRAYKNLKTDEERLRFCFEKYSIWKKRWVLSTRLYGSNVWREGIRKLNINCK
jgi:hypothetical protein